MTMNISIEEYKVMQSKVSEYESKILEHTGRMAEKQEQLDAILQKYDVQTVDQLRTLFKIKQGEAEVTYGELNHYVGELAQKIERLGG